VTLSRQETRVKPPCPLCEGEDVEVYSEAPAATLDASALGSSRKNVSHGRILRCRDCKFVFSQLRPPDEQLHTLYRAMDPSVYEKEAHGRRKTGRKHLAIIQKYKHGGKLLDAGCASGVLLSCAADAGWEVTGVEPSEVLAEKAKESLGGRGAVICATLQDADLPRASFDVLTLWDVLEHVREPVPFLETCVSLIKPGGYLIANVPDIRSQPARLLGERWPLLLAEHLNYFDRDTLKLIGERVKLEWIAFGRRPASFSVDYICYRLAQHRVIGMRLAHRAVTCSSLGRLCIPVFLGESYVVWMRPK
jgi:2-polyprenyl-3-methyl-5-hydroxy-6-metoxy-1,4-benzoquinol methylase